MRSYRRRPKTRPLLSSTDHGTPIDLPAAVFLEGGRDGWEALAERFIDSNRRSLEALGLTPIIHTGLSGTKLWLHPGARAGAIPLRSPLTGRVVAGCLVRPRFGWAGIGRLLQQTGWRAAPDILEMPVVPGSATEVPPWVMAGPVLFRLAELVRQMKRGYEFVDETRGQPKGTIRWAAYARRSLAQGTPHRVPCRFPQLGADPHLSRAIRWTVERVHRELSAVAGRDRIAGDLVARALQLLELLRHVASERPREEQLRTMEMGGLIGEVLRKGLQAIGWVVEERGLGGSDTWDGLAWTLSLERLWEQYVEADYRNEARRTGATVHAGDKGETTFPLKWSSYAGKSMTHLVPDLVIQRADEIQIVDAKYKAHFAELDARGWRDFEAVEREAHRADVHQVLAYAALYDATKVRATLVYPLRQSTFENLVARGQDRTVASLYHGHRQLTLELRGMPFGVHATR
jgi:hypothetical protein